MYINFILAPVIGAIIGYITNDIAIKMLFHPRKTLYIGKWRVPFTPGLIPKEKDRVARSVGNVVSTQLLNSDVISDTLTSDEMIEKIRRALENIVEKNRDNESTVEAVIEKISPKEVTSRIITELKEDLAGLIYKKLVGFKFGENISKIALQKMKEKMDASLFSVISFMIDDNMIDLLSQSIGEYIDNIIANNSEEIIKDLIGTEVDKLKNEKICVLIEKYDSKIPGLIDFIVSTYKKIITNNLAQILGEINLARIVEDRISAFDVMELENMIFGIMNKELKAIVYLGAALGFLMGFINVALMMI